MSTSMEIPLTDVTLTKALHVREVADGKFRNVNILIKPYVIVLTGDEYENVLQCKQWFLMMVGIVPKPSKRRHNSNPSVADGACRNPGNESLTRYITYEKINVHVTEGDMVRCNEDEFSFEKIDCFVNPTNSELVANSILSKALQDAGGESYKILCEKARPVVSRLKVTECYVTGGGNIKCDHVMHAICPIKPVFSFRDSIEEEVFKTVFNCLKMAEKRCFRSIALPFICTGQGRLDVQVCSEQYAFAVLEFSRLRKNAFFPEIIVFIDIDKTKVNTVSSVFEEILPKTNFELQEVPKLSGNEANTSSASISTVSTDTSPNLTGDSLTSESDMKLNEAKRCRSYSDSSTSRSNISLTSTVPDLEHPKTLKSYSRLESEDSDSDCKKVNQEPVKLVRRVPDEKYGNTIWHNIGKYKLALEVGDIRSSRTVAIVCPENIKEPRGGLLAAAIKCRFRRSFDSRSIKKVNANSIATTEHKTGSGDIQFVLHVPTMTWTKDFTPKNHVKTAIQTTFDKLKRHRKRNIRSIAIPLMGTSSTENEEVVGNCCLWQVEKVLDILQWEDIVNLEKVCLINRCDVIRNTLQALVKRKLGKSSTK